MTPLPPCETIGLINLCQPGSLITGGGWFTLQVPNLVWFLAVAGLLVAGLFLELPAQPLPPEAGPETGGSKEAGK